MSKRTWTVEVVGKDGAWRVIATGLTNGQANAYLDLLAKGPRVFQIIDSERRPFYNC